MASGRDIARVIAVSVVAALAVAFLFRLNIIGFAVLAVAAVGAWFILRPSPNNPEVAALRASLSIARDDITDVLNAYDTLLHGTTTEAIADRTLYYPALAEPNSTVPAIEEFQLRASAARRYVARIDAHLTDPAVDRATLDKLLTITDERARELALSWADARRAAQQLGPGNY